MLGPHGTQNGAQQADIVWATDKSGGLGLFIHSLIGLDRSAAVEAFGGYLDGNKFSADQVHFDNLIVDELTANGVVEPRRLFESSYTDHAPTGPDSGFPDADVEVIVDILKTSNEPRWWRPRRPDDNDEVLKVFAV